MARIAYIDESACHVVLEPADLLALEVERELVVPRATHEALTRRGRLAERHVPGTRALVVRLEVPACP